ncbi:MAG: iron ABC transporter permease [Archangium sp.]|nr:iron ABC transporter permease [Archangium sp.]
MSRPLFSLRRLVTALLACFAVALGAFVLAVAFGEQALDLDQVRTPGSSQELIFYSLRLPRVVLAALVGCALASSGAMLQSLLRNPLADPFVLGVSGGAALGATVALAFGLSVFAWVPGLSAVSAFALLGALGATVLVLVVGRLAGGNSPNTTLLAGVIFNAFALAAITFIKALVAPDKLGEILFWLAGSLGNEQWSTLGSTAIVVLLAVGALVVLSPRLNLLTLGEEDAQSLGVDVKWTRRLLLVTASVAVAAVVSLSGLVGFVGLLVPQLTRLLFGVDQRISVPASALLGAAFLMLADLFARLLFRVFQTEPPVGVITALLGGPLFLALMARQRRG